MCSYTSMTQRNPWEDRWSQPALPDLLAPLKAHHKKHLERLIEAIDAFEGARRSIIWYGPSWKWTLQYTLDELPESDRVLCYLVPNTAGLTVSVPLSDGVILGLPKKRISKFVRDGIRSAKRAVSIHWAVWTPSTDGETAHLLDLIRRKHQHLTQPQSA